MKLKKGSIALLTLAGMFYMSVQKADACTRAVYIGPDNMYKPQNKMFHFCKTFCSKITLVNTIQNVI